MLRIREGECGHGQGHETGSICYSFPLVWNRCGNLISECHVKHMMSYAMFLEWI